MQERQVHVVLEADDKAVVDEVVRFGVYDEGGAEAVAAASSSNADEAGVDAETTMEVLLRFVPFSPPGGEASKFSLLCRAGGCSMLHP